MVWICPECKYKNGIEWWACENCHWQIDEPTHKKYLKTEEPPNYVSSGLTDDETQNDDALGRLFERAPIDFGKSCRR